MTENKIFITPDPDLAEEAEWYQGQLGTHLTNAKEAVESKDFESLQTIGHRMKGSAESFGFDEAGVIGKTIESAAKMNDSDEIADALEKLEDYLDRIEIVS